MRKWISFGCVVLLVSVFFTGCGRRPPTMGKEVFLYVSLGNTNGCVGSNYDLLTNAGIVDDVEVKDYLDVPTSIQIIGKKVYIADKYRGVISVFSSGNFGKAVPQMEISNMGEGYAFETVFQVAVNKYGEIYAVASLTNTNVYETQGATNERENYLIYKFTYDGRFLYTIGINGINTAPMPMPDFIDLDLFGNLYVYFREDRAGELYWKVKRYSSSGELNFEFDSQYIAKKHEIDGEMYQSELYGIANLKNDERLIFFTANYLFKNQGDKGNQLVGYRSILEMYSILKNTVSRQLLDEKQRMEDVLGITADDTIVLYGYDEKYRVIRFHFYDMFKNQHTYQYAPVLSDYYANFGFYLDQNGELYSLVVKENKHYILLHWKKKNQTKVFE
ncbi:NHL repeat-containing protein [Thermospira aquatica]|uniref:Lipoprotein n=1 Tax=Thermospira aquatica TaxID=2828656 RepID=A0AAX3BD28_9SPIR|nr:hypothetical protein [Thermospira aquatica]URA10178.1 hypothetical protein KDW03_11975 [Thermospira aquatica]